MGNGVCLVHVSLVHVDGNQEVVLNLGTGEGTQREKWKELVQGLTHVKELG
jgi:hypothetical protein